MQDVGRAMRTDPDSIWSVEQAAAASADFAELHAAHGGLLWVKFDPVQARCGLFFWRDGKVNEITPPGFSVRSRVYEYGGGACCATDKGAAFVNESDQQVYWLDITGHSGVHAVPSALTTAPQCRYGDLAFVPAWQALLAVEESREAAGVVHRLVRIGLDGSHDVLAEGADFYAAPVASADGKRLAWIEWDRPDQPWIATRLCHRKSGEQTQVLSGQRRDQALQQPRFDPLGRLWVLSDQSGWWQPWCVDDSASGAYGEPCDHAPAPWQLGGRTFLPLDDGRMLLTRFQQGFGVLEASCTLRTDYAAHQRLAEGFTRFRALVADAENFYCVAAAADRLPAVLAIARDTGAVSVLAGGEAPLSEEHLARPQPFCFGVGEDERCHGFFYAPRPATERPPLVIFLHGGPTSACYPVFDPRIAFWTLRGYAVLDLNYRGSSGYGRVYRLCLNGRWGELEVADIRAAIGALVANGAIDPQCVFVRGASAGGYSALRALAELPGLRGGASLYGVSDPLALRRVTHKFEADYIDWLIGDPAQDAERYQARTPVLQAGRIAVPVIFFQGALDAVVVPSQTEAMVAALRERSLSVEYRLFAGERHGIREAHHLAEALRAEHAFYERLRQSN
ncbi:prolyl oligopeptidase family serine peptidase [Pseudomonas sp. QE6]|uniref:S9 family peptidase n=1 Tax=Pseudomonas sp. QE6 TaxID=3242491 RepID=UPI0035274C3D